MARVTTGTITRTLLGLSNLSIGAGADDTWQAGQLTPSGREWDRVTTSSPFFHGRVLRAATMRTATLSGEIIVRTPITDDPSVLETRVADLVEALSQFTYVFTVVVTDGANSQSWAYACEPADVVPTTSINAYARHRFVTCRVTIPHRPIPNAGTW